MYGSIVGVYVDYAWVFLKRWVVNTALIIDDSRLARLTLKRLIAKHNIKVYECEGVTEAERWIEHNPAPDIIFLDIMMPEIDGFEGLERFRANKKTKQLPIVMYSGDVTEASRVNARELGASGYLPKPANANRVNHLITVLSERSSDKTRPQAQAEKSASSKHEVANEHSSTKPVSAATSSAQSALSLELKRRIDALERSLEALEDDNSEKIFRIALERQKRELTFLQRQVSKAEKRSIVAFIVSLLAFLLAILSVGIGILFWGV